MSWSWSHTTEGLLAAKGNLEKLPHTTLVCIWAEWQAAVTREAYAEPSLDPEAYRRALRQGDRLPDDVLASDIWDRAEAQAICDRGGFQLWMCPFGCGAHTVAPGPAEEGEE